VVEVAAPDNVCNVVDPENGAEVVEAVGDLVYSDDQQRFILVFVPRIEDLKASGVNSHQLCSANLGVDRIVANLPERRGGHRRIGALCLLTHQPSFAARRPCAGCARRIPTMQAPA
jgi:hypothetical protein